jgi:outer membrane cobalamin receptor
MKLRTLHVFLVLALSAAAAAAEQTVPTDLSRLTLEELLNIPVVIVTRTIEGAARAPARVDVVTAAQIQRRAYRSLMDLLEDLPGFKVDTAVDQDISSDVTVQGTRGTGRLVVLLDGIRISSPTGEPLPILANYPVHNARQVEILYGPASAVYGADAFSGVINIISRDVTEAEGLRVRTSVGQSGLSSTETSFGTRLGSRASLVVAGQYLYDRQPDLSRVYPDLFNGLDSHRTGVFNTIFGPMTPAVPVADRYRLPVRARSFQATMRAGGLQVMLFESVLRASNTPAYTPDNAVYNDIAYQQNELLIGAASYTRAAGSATHTTTVSAGRHEMDPSSGYLNVYSGMQRSYKFAYGSMLKAEHQTTWRAAPSWVITTGGAHERYFSIPQTADLNAPVRSRATGGTILGTTIEDQFFRLHYTTTGGYAQAQWNAAPAVSLTGGLRADYNSRFGATFNPRVGLVTYPGGITTIKAMYGTAFLAPSPYQAYLRYGSFSSDDGGETYRSPFWHVPNPDLRPQRVRTLETQIQQQLAASVTFTATGFVSLLRDLVRDSDISAGLSGTYLGWPVEVIQTSVNGGREDTWGGTLAVDSLHAFGVERQLRLRADVSVANGRVYELDAPGRYVESGGITPLMFRATADFDWGAWSVAPRLLVVSRQRALATEATAARWRRRTIDGYATLDVAVQRRNVFTNVDGFVTIDNALDARYRHMNLRAFTNPEEFEGSPQNPRRITVGVQLHLR